MSQFLPPTAPDMQVLLSTFMKTRAVASIRAEGTARMLGDLRVSGVEPGVAIQFSGAKRRDQLLPPGAMLSLSILLDEKAYYLRVPMLDPLLSSEGDTQFPPVLRVGWPTEPVQVRKRRDLRVATPDQQPLPARLLVSGRWMDARLLNLTETGLGLSLAEVLELPLRTPVRVETQLPGGHLLVTVGEVRHLEITESDELPTRVGIVLRHADASSKELLHRFVQERRTDRSDAMRQTT